MSEVYREDAEAIVEAVRALGTECEAVVWFAPHECLGFTTHDPHVFLLRLGKALGADVIDAEVVEALDDGSVRLERSGSGWVVFYTDVKIMAE